MDTLMREFLSLFGGVIYWTSATDLTSTAVAREVTFAAFAAVMLYWILGRLATQMAALQRAVDKLEETLRNWAKLPKGD
jgi:hypothetical protein